MKNINGITWVTILVMIIAAGSIQAANQTEKVIADEKFQVNDNATLGIEHKYGEVTIKNWDENAISVKVIVTMKDISEEKADRLLDKINVKVQGDRNGVIVESDISQKLFENSNNKLAINMNIYVPRNIQLEMEHMFGNAFVESVEGRAEISVQYGSIEIVSLLGENNELDLGFGSAEIEYFARGEIGVSYSELNVKKAEKLEVDAEYSDVEIDEVGEIEIENEGGQIKIGSGSQIALSAKFTDVQVQKLSGTLIAETEYGNLNVSGIHKDFSSVQIENSFGSVLLAFEDGATYNLQAELELCSLDYPEKLADFSRKVTTTTDAIYEGVIGNGKGARASVSIISEYGGVTIKH